MIRVKKLLKSNLLNFLSWLVISQMIYYIFFTETLW